MNFRYGFIFAFLYIAVEMIMFTMGWQYSDYAQVAYYSSLTLCLMVAILLSIVHEQKKHKGKGYSFLIDLKTGLKTAGIFTLFITTFIFCYYQFIDPHFIPNKIEQVKSIAESQDFEQLKEEIPLQLKTIHTKEQFVEAQIDKAKFWMDSKKLIPFSLLFIMLLGSLYTFILTLLTRKVFKR